MHALIFTPDPPFGYAWLLYFDSDEQIPKSFSY